jgi:hypothetical protein
MTKETYNCHECGEVQPPPSPGDYPICGDCLNEGPVTRFDRFDIVEAHYAFYGDNHGGQSCDFYKRLCHIGTFFIPGGGWKGFSSLTSNGSAIYFDLCNKHDVAPF